MHLVLTIDTTKKKTLQRQIYEQIHAMIVEGRLRTGDRLPAIRELSGQLNIARNTVALAYDHLAAEGYVEGEPSIGTFVSSQIPFHVDSAPGSSGQRQTHPDGGAAIAPTTATWSWDLRPYLKPTFAKASDCCAIS